MGIVKRSDLESLVDSRVIVRPSGFKASFHIFGELQRYEDGYACSFRLRFAGHSVTFKVSQVTDITDTKVPMITIQPK